MWVFTPQLPHRPPKRRLRAALRACPYCKAAFPAFASEAAICEHVKECLSGREAPALPDVFLPMTAGPPTVFPLPSGTPVLRRSPDSMRWGALGAPWLEGDVRVQVRTAAEGVFEAWDVDGLEVAAVAASAPLAHHLWAFVVLGGRADAPDSGPLEVKAAVDATVAAFAWAIAEEGLSPAAARVALAQCFEAWAVPSPPPNPAAKRLRTRQPPQEPVVVDYVPTGNVHVDVFASVAPLDCGTVRASQPGRAGWRPVRGTRRAVVRDRRSAMALEARVAQWLKDNPALGLSFASDGAVSSVSLPKWTAVHGGGAGGEEAPRVPGAAAEVPIDALRVGPAVCPKPKVSGDSAIVAHLVATQTKRAIVVQYCKDGSAIMRRFVDLATTPSFAALCRAVRGMAPLSVSGPDTVMEMIAADGTPIASSAAGGPSDFMEACRTVHRITLTERVVAAKGAGAAVTTVTTVDD